MRGLAEILVPIEHPEIVIGLVGPIGVDLPAVINSLRLQLARVKYDSELRAFSSLIGVGGSSCSWFLPCPWVTRFSPRSALRPPHHGVRRVGVPICVATFGAAAPRLRALSGIASPAVPTGTTRLRPRRAAAATWLRRSRPRRADQRPAGRDPLAPQGRARARAQPGDHRQALGRRPAHLAEAHGGRGPGPRGCLTIRARTASPIRGGELLTLEQRPERVLPAMLLPETAHELLMVWKAVPVGHPPGQLTGLKQVAGSVAVGLAARRAQHGRGHGPVEDHGTQRMRGGERLRHRPQHEVEVTVDLFGSRQDETLGRFGFVDPGQETQGAADILVAFLGGGDRPVRPATPLSCRDPLDVVAEMLEAERLPEPVPTGRLSLRIPAQRLEGLDPQVDVPGLPGPMPSAAVPVQPVEGLAGSPGGEHPPGDLDRAPLRMTPRLTA